MFAHPIRFDGKILKANRKIRTSKKQNSLYENVKI